MGAETRADGSQRRIAQQSRAAIAEMQPPFGEARDQRQEASHATAAPFGVDQGFAENHVAAALSINRLAFCRGLAKTADEGFRTFELSGPELRIAAREINRIRGA